MRLTISPQVRYNCSSDVDMEDDCVFNMISVVDREMNVYDRRLCLLWPVGTADLRILRDRCIGDLRMNHSRTISWDPGIADSWTISVCYDCLCLMALFRTVMYLAHYWAVRIVWTGPDEGNGRYIAWREQYLPGLYPSCVVDQLHEVMMEIKVFHCVSMIHVDENNNGPRCVRVCGVSLGMFSMGRISLMLTDCSICVGGSVDYSDWPRADCVVDFSNGEVRISYIRQGLLTDSLIDAAPVTGSLIDSALSDCLILLCTAGFSSTWTFCSTDFVLLAGFVLSVRQVNDFGIMAADGAALAEVRAGITFGVELYVPWDAPDAVVDVSSEGVVPLRNILDVIELVGRREGAAESRVPGRSQCVSPGSGLSGSGPELSAVSIQELSARSQQWPPAVLSHMGWRQKELEEMRSAAKQQFSQSRPSSCVYCGSLIKLDMYRYVARLHLDLAQLWRCPVSWCTVWKGTPQDCMDHLRGSHNVPWEVKSASLEKFLPPWTVSRKV